MNAPIRHGIQALPFKPSCSPKSCSQGDEAQHFYIIKSGEVEIIKSAKDGSRKRIGYKYQGDFFGDEALMKRSPRDTTVVAASQHGRPTEVMIVDRSTFQDLLGPIRDVMNRSSDTLRVLDAFAVPLFAELTADLRAELVKRLTLVQFNNGEIVFKQGDVGDKLYIIKEGKASIIRDEELCSSPGVCTGERVSGRELDRLYRGQYFGERALLKHEPRMASVVAVGKLLCYSLAKSDFEAMAMTNKMRWSLRWAEEDTREPANLEVERMMGSGAFGTAWLVRHRQYPDRSFALKTLEKKQIQRQNWRMVVMREKDILAGLPPHPNVIALYQTFQDEHHLFMLMELAVGGELYKLLSKERRFDNDTARFFCASVVLALSHLHSLNVIFRDLKPENLLLDKKGYIKLIDMGFAKKLAPGEKTYTLCGT
eukprot:3517838-Prymnesium_polylepis.2